MDIGAQYEYSSGILLGSLAGDITLGNISADLVLAAALGLDGLLSDDYDENGVPLGNGNIYDVGDVQAHYLGLLARNNIGTADTPINTDVDILSAYSWDSGNIYINEANSIELGLYLPLYGYLVQISNGNGGQQQIGALGLSVAANDGIINISSGGDMLVNSVVSPNGGVFLESREGNIYAGTGWCPAGYCEGGQEPASVQTTSTFNLFNTLADMVMMDGWSEFGGPDYFLPGMVSDSLINWVNDGELYGNPYLMPGPNVLAGSYSYFSTPNGTIGVGTPEDASVYNPLEVCILAVNEDSDSWAVPQGFTPQAGLTLNIGGSSAGDGFTIDTGNGNGSLGVSGAIRGIVRPGVTAVTGVFPAPDIDNTSTSPLNPPGYVFYEDVCSDCCLAPDRPTDVVKYVFQPPTAGYLPQHQIWPGFGQTPTPPDISGGTQFLASTLKEFKIYYELNSNFRLSTASLVNSTDFYAYHPVTETDESAFDGISLDVEAYEFIEQNINLKKKIAPYFGGEAEENDEQNTDVNL